MSARAAALEGEDDPLMAGTRFRAPVRCYGLLATGIIFTVACGLLATQVPSRSRGWHMEQKSELDDRIAELLQEMTKILNGSEAVARRKATNGCVVGDLSNKSAIWADPLSLFCFAVVIEAEMPMIRWQYDNKAGLFGCTTWAVYSIEPMLIGRKPADGSPIMTTAIPGPNALFGEAYFGSCGKKQKYIQNANVFVRAWETVVAAGTAGLHSWIVKVDPDTAFCPRRLQKLVAKKALDSTDEMGGRYFINCQVFNSMQGSLEVLSREAFYIFGGRKLECQQKMDWWHMGEDIFTNRCLEEIGVRKEDLTEGVADSYCVKKSGCVQPGSQPTCTAPDVAAFHPLKKSEEFKACWEQMQQVERASGNISEPLQKQLGRSF